METIKSAFEELRLPGPLLVMCGRAYSLGEHRCNEVAQATLNYGTAGRSTLQEMALSPFRVLCVAADSRCRAVWMFTGIVG